MKNEDMQVKTDNRDGHRSPSLSEPCPLWNRNSKQSSDLQRELVDNALSRLKEKGLVAISRQDGLRNPPQKAPALKFDQKVILHGTKRIVITKFPMTWDEDSKGIRLNKFLSEAGVCSRKEADQRIMDGHVKVNGEVVTELGSRVTPNDSVKLLKKKLKLKSKVYILVNKPYKFVMDMEKTSEDKQRVLDLVQPYSPERLFTVGSLHPSATGAVLITNDGELHEKLTRLGSKKRCVYILTLDKPMGTDDMRRVKRYAGSRYAHTIIKSIQHKVDGKPNEIVVKLLSGSTDDLCRILWSNGYHIFRCDRVYYLGLTVKGLRRGKWRYLTPEEVVKLRSGNFL